MGNLEESEFTLISERGFSSEKDGFKKTACKVSPKIKVKTMIFLIVTVRIPLQELKDIQGNFYKDIFDSHHNSPSDHGKGNHLLIHK
ncbi:MAG TPA: hypothetical protein PLC07_02430 [Bacillota bacterium]|nr:hypothetical protein [Bacillota bacterium]HPT88606.1 hypothetical protein [Bacillota bacterium]